MIVFVHLFNDRSGSPKILSQVATILSGRGVHTEMLTSSSGDGFLKGIADKDRSIFYRRSECLWKTLFFYILSQSHLFLACLKYWRKDAVFYINTMMPAGALLAARLMRKEVICHVHETSIKPRLFKLFLRSIVGFCASKIVFVSDYLRRVEGFPIEDQRVIYNALSEGTKLHSDDKSFFSVLMVCSLKEYKGVFEFFEVASALRGESFINFVLVLNAKEYEIDTFFEAVDIPDNVRIFSRQDDMTLFYSEASLVLNLSKPNGWIETFGLTLIEAFSFGVPVIAPEIGGPAEVVSDGVEGYLIDSSRVSEIVKKIYDISNDGAEWNRLSLNARKKAKDFMFPVFEEKILELISSDLKVGKE